MGNGRYFVGVSVFNFWIFILYSSIPRIIIGWLHQPRFAGVFFYSFTGSPLNWQVFSSFHPVNIGIPPWCRHASIASFLTIATSASCCNVSVDEQPHKKITIKSMIYFFIVFFSSFPYPELSYHDLFKLLTITFSKSHIICFSCLVYGFN